MAPVTRYATVSGGIRLPYLESGDEDGLPLLLLHGYSDSMRSFDLLRPHLPPGLRAIALSQRGHGDADRPDAPYVPETYAADAIALLDALGVEQAVVLGHSMGSQTALRLALDHPERVLGVILIGGFSTIRGNPVVEELWDAVSALSDPVSPEFVDEFQRSTVARPVPEDFMALVVQESLKLPARVWKAVCRGQMDTDLLPELGWVSAPTLLLWGDRDAIIPRSMQDALAAAIPRVRLTILSGTGHAPHWEEPRRVAEEIEAFALRVVRPSRLVTA